MCCRLAAGKFDWPDSLGFMCRNISQLLCASSCPRMKAIEFYVCWLLHCCDHCYVCHCCDISPRHKRGHLTSCFALKSTLFCSRFPPFSEGKRWSCWLREQHFWVKAGIQSAKVSLRWIAYDKLELHGKEQVNQVSHYVYMMSEKTVWKCVSQTFKMHVNMLVWMKSH